MTVATRPSWQLHGNFMATDPPVNLVALVSGDGSNLQAILDNIAGGTLSATVAAVISDRPEAFALVRAARAGVPAVVVARRDHRSRSAFYAALLREVESFAPDLVVLAGFMRILPAPFIEQLDGKIMNIHPSLLPKFKGIDTHQRALDAGVSRHGATVHWVTAALDDGPIIVQAEVEVAPGDNAETLRARVLREEHRIYTRAIQWFAKNRGARKTAAMPPPAGRDAANTP